MELGLGFADDDLKGDNKIVKQCLTSYNAKICEPKWFLADEGEDNESASNIKKHQADFYYGNQKYNIATQCYKEAIGTLSSQNRVMRKDMMESLSRCYCYLGDEEKAMAIIAELVSGAITTDNMVQALMLKQQILNKSGRVQEETEVIKQLLGYHSYSAHFWLMLMRACRKQLSTSCFTDENGTINDSAQATGTLSTDGDSVNLESKLKTLALVDSTNTGRSDSISSPANTEAGKHNKDLKMNECSDVPGIRKSEQKVNYESKGADNLDSCESTERSMASLDTERDSEEHLGPSIEKHSADCNQMSCTNEDKDVTEVCSGDSRTGCGLITTSAGATPLQMKLITCCIRARLLLRSVQGSVGSFVKARNLELLSEVDRELEDLCIEESVVQSATEHILKDFYQTSESEGEEDKDSRHQPDRKPNDSVTEDFDEKWFAWIKNI